jgi:pimeloyl-ACP methyl ester carboxylesterase
MAGLSPEVEPSDAGMLDVGDGNRVYWEVCGNPDGVPALVLHGGPGSGCTPWMRRFFDPNAYRIVLFDQRDCGRSTPHACDPTTDLAVNTTEHLLADIQLLRQHLGVDRWVVFGGSWGSTLGLAYAERHPEQVSAIVLFGVATTRRSDAAWLEDGVLLREAFRLAEIPGVMVHGRLDLGSPLVTAWELAQAWPESELAIVDGAGHFDPSMIEHLVAATDGFAKRS